MSKIRVLFLCMGNSARSQMAEAFLRAEAGELYEAFSAGLTPSEIHPLTRQVMSEVGNDLTGQRAKGMSEYLGKIMFQYVITVCDKAQKECPNIFPGMGERLYWRFDDPVAAKGSEEERLAVFRRVRDEIRDRIREWVAEK